MASPKDAEGQQQPVTPKQQERKDEELEKVKITSPVVNASVVLLYGVLTSMFIIGWFALNSCPANKIIPVYLIVAGSTGILTKALLNTKNKHLFNFLIVLVLFDISWQFYGSYVVYKEYQPNYDQSLGIYCHRTAYLLAFWIITLIYSLTFLFLLLSACYFLMRNTFRKI